MNYFELHVGDYDAATAHLSMLEDAAYGRMLRIYYRTEKPLPADPKQVCRLVRAQSKPERDAVLAVLEEFFELQDDGWHQARADAELARFRDSEPEREQRKTNEETRLKRHREERAALFKVLNDNGQHAPWNTKMEELRALAAPFQARPATGAATPPETAPATPATATHGNVSPPPTTHYPLPKEKGEGAGGAPPSPPAPRVGTGEGPPEAGGQQPTAAGLACRAIKAAGIIDVNPGHPLLLRLLAGGVTAQDLADTATELAGKGKAKFALLLATVEGRLRDAAAAGSLPVGAPAADPWDTRNGVEAFARDLGLKAWDETCQFAEYRRTVRAAYDRRHAAAGATT